MERSNRVIRRRMPRYYFHVFNDEVTFDSEGQELAGLDEARRVAVEAARSLICQSVGAGHIDLSHRLDVNDERGSVVLSVPFGSVLEIRG